MEIYRSIACVVVLLSIYYCREAAPQGSCGINYVKCNRTGICKPASFLCDGDNDCGDNEDEENCDTCRTKVKCNITGNCISTYNVCDGSVDCGGNEDEKYCNNCSGSNFWCNSTKTCVSSYEVCDGNYNCPNGEDEQICGNCPSDRSFKCESTNSQCINSYSACDGHKDCNGGEDEINCDSCSVSRFLCNSTKTCVYSFQVCDGRNDCPNGEDEHICGSSCPSDKPFKCNSTNPSKCISLSSICDVSKNCDGGEDEINCDKCPGYGFLCNSTRTCVYSSQVCDGNYDCPNGEDEQICGNCLSDRPIKCGSTNSECVRLSDVCDETKHCNGGEDEINCDKCSNFGFLCNSTKTCVSSYKACDGNYDCPNGEDEQICDSCPSARLFKCNSPSSKCIYLTSICDAFKDCNGGEDEINCDRCSRSGFLCKSTKTCVRFFTVCDGRYDCPNGEDEQICATSTRTTIQPIVSSNPFTSTSTSKSTKGGFEAEVSSIYTQRTQSTTTSTSMSTVMSTIIVSTTPFIPNSTSEYIEGDGETQGNPTKAPILGTGSYVGIILGGIVGLLIFAAIIFLLYRHVKQRNRHKCLEEAKRKSVMHLEGISNSAMNISDDTSNTVASENLQQPYYNSPLTLDRIRPQANSQSTMLDKNSAVDSNYMTLNDKRNVESLHPYDSLKINDISNALASANLQQSYYNSPSTLDIIIPQANSPSTRLDSNSSVDSNYMALKDKGNRESLNPYDSLKINDISNVVASENLQQPYYNIPSTLDRIIPQANSQSTSLDSNSPVDSSYMALKDKETRESLHHYDSLQIN